MLRDKFTARLVNMNSNLDDRYGCLNEGVWCVASLPAEPLWCHMVEKIPWRVTPSGRICKPFPWIPNPSAWICFVPAGIPHEAWWGKHGVSARDKKHSDIIIIQRIQ